MITNWCSNFFKSGQPNTCLKIVIVKIVNIWQKIVEVSKVSGESRDLSEASIWPLFV